MHYGLAVDCLLVISQCCNLFYVQTGWDANEMFNTNAEKFNIQSDYDPNLTQYTWVWLSDIIFCFFDMHQTFYRWSLCCLNQMWGIFEKLMVVTWHPAVAWERRCYVESSERVLWLLSLPVSLIEVRTSPHLATCRIFTELIKTSSLVANIPHHHCQSRDDRPNTTAVVTDFSNCPAFRHATWWTKW